MSKQGKKQRNVDDTTHVEATVTEAIDAQQAVENTAEFAKTADHETASELDTANETAQPDNNEKDSDVAQSPVKDKQERAKSGGKAIAVLALLIALGVGGAGHFFANKKFGEVEQQIQQLKQVAGQSTATSADMPSFEAEKAQLAALSENYQQALAKIEQLQREQSLYTNQINGLQTQLQKLGSTPKADQSAWLLSDADFLLNNALRKMVLDNDIDSTKSLLIEADNVLSQVTDNKVMAVREAIKADLNQLASLNQVDQNNIMQRLGQLANQVDDMPMLETGETTVENGEVSDSLADWQQNLEKSADSFLSHFIRVSDKGKATEKVFIAPNQAIYLRENIRLRLQIAILAVPRQQNELYKQSLEAVSSWVRSYFEGQNAEVKNFLKEVDELIEQSIYIDAPSRLQSLALLEQMMNKAAKPVEKIQLEADNALTPAEEPKPAVPDTEPAPNAETQHGQ